MGRYRRDMRRCLAALAACAVLGMSACSSGDPAKPEASEPTPAQRLAAAKQKADGASSVHLLITSRDVPADAEGILGADGGPIDAYVFQSTPVIADGRITRPL